MKTIAAPEQVGRAPAEEQEAAVRERVRRDHPLQVLLGEVEVAPIDGSATLTIAMSSTTTKIAVQMRMSAFQRRGSGAAAFT